MFQFQRAVWKCSPLKSSRPSSLGICGTGRSPPVMTTKLACTCRFCFPLPGPLFSVRPRRPLLPALVPDLAVDLGPEEGLQVPLLGDAVGVGAKLWLVGVLVLGHVSRLLKQRHVHVALDVTHQSWVPVPVPCPTVPASRVHDYDVLGPETGLDEADGKDEAAVSGAVDEDLAFRTILEHGFLGIQRVMVDERVFVEVLEGFSLVEIDELGQAVLTEALVALLLVLLQRLRVRLDLLHLRAYRTNHSGLLN
ncbi:hypothetical protein MPH_12101 [Macrophomina phaseolina MS6]|uniref:Uncharacterized protein n=1 Tax=Macrophomina phaseolina (strain MS6) TaxID=1126212 RepID=K2S225_MACPH|nr:hypothetical protein MPH_12101 [Macrophomina phaseolina MS6]